MFSTVKSLKKIVHWAQKHDILLNVSPPPSRHDKKAFDFSRFALLTNYIYELPKEN